MSRFDFAYYLDLEILEDLAAEARTELGRSDDLQPEPVRVTRYRCPCCRKTWSNRATVEGHIARCWYNPNVRSCKTCAHFPGWRAVGCAKDMPFPEKGLPTQCTAWEPLA